MWDDFAAAIGEVFEILDDFFEKHRKSLLVLMIAFAIGVIAGYGTAFLEYHATEQAEAYVETIGEEEGENVR